MSEIAWFRQLTSEVRYSFFVPGFTIGFCFSIVLTASCVLSAQDAPRDALPLLKPCNHKNPAPCIDKPPEVIHFTDPKCSVAAHNAKISGTVVLWTIIDTDGLAHDVKVARSLGYGLDALAVEALQKWTFISAKSAKKAVPAQINVEIPFQCR